MVSDISINLYNQQAQQNRLLQNTDLSNSAPVAARQETSQAITDRLDISEQALARPSDRPPNYWEKFYPGQADFSTYNLANAVTNPSDQPFSQNRSFPEVAQAARESLDARYDDFLSTGPDEDISRYTQFGELDRRALFAVASNEGGLFTKEEQRNARDLMRQQQGNALGFGSGPISAGDDHVSPYFGNRAAAFEAGINFLDNVSVEERATDFEYAQQRAASQRIYEQSAKDQGQIPKDLSSDNSLVQLLHEAFETFGNSIDEGNPLSANFSEYLQGYEERIEQALEQNRQQLYNNT